MKFFCENKPLNANIQHLYVAGWTGRDAAAVQHHIDELAELGVAPPSQVPLYYRVSENLLIQAEEVAVVGETTSGEVEPMLVRLDGQLWLGLASDHTDRELEAYSVAASKQACVKPAAQGLWKFDEVKDHLDQLVLSCEVYEACEWVSYQEGPLAAIRPLVDLLDGADMPDQSAMLCGTLGAKGGVRPAEHYRMRLTDPVLHRGIELSYSVRTLPIVS
ncbi:DUF2848 domain-containing protein [Epibacterium ulvae]|uniref:DUF2848 domain-containing protein n=1 Tax=Epibacterium ulvae TaxID=1156985 RepID=UPI001BFC9EDE|nr:DUF2848 domain-containing protein [Epibacterium ulvae]MBT8153417.1 DUF2848 domain-containing protein [Epibacterium ulvae]